MRWRRSCAILTLLSVAESIVVRQKADAAFDCTTLAVNLTVRGKDFGPLASTICQWWPSAFGEFPGQNVSDISNLLQQVFAEGGIYDQITEAFNKPNPKYCLRQEVNRNLITMGTQSAEDKECPATITQDILEEMVIDGTDDARTKGYWSCEEESDDSCLCNRRDDRTVGAMSMSKRARNCKMVHSNKCYGDCPKGYQPTFLKGWFRPVCTSVCGSTNHPFSCGIGCANSRVNCVAVIIQQVGEIAIAASRVASFFSGTALFSETVIAVKKVAEFALTIMVKIANIADKIFTKILREKVELTLLLSLFQFVKEEVLAFKDDWVTFSGLVKSSSQLFLQLFDAELGWKSIDLGWIAGSIMQHDSSVLQNAFAIVKQFAYKPCELADDTVVFVVNEVGDQRMNGPWAQHGEVAGKPRYRLIMNKDNVMMEWSGSNKEWGMWVKDRSFGRGWWWGWLGFGWRKLYTNGKNTASFPHKDWKQNEGAIPAPVLVGAKDGGE